MTASNEKSRARMSGRFLAFVLSLAVCMTVGLPTWALSGGDDGHEGHEGDIYIGIKNGALFTGLIGSHDDHDHGDDDHGDDDHGDDDHGDDDHGDDDHGDDDHGDDDHDDDHGDDDHDDDHGDDDHGDDDHGDDDHGDDDHDDDHGDDDHGDDDHGDDDHDDDHGDDDHGDDDHDEEYPEVRVFGAEMGELGIPGFTSDPGWEAYPGTFSADTWLGWNATHGLERWNGSGFDGSISEMLTISYGSGGPSFNVANSAADGFELACAPDGSFHLHLNFLLSGADGGFGQPGIYLLELEMYALGENIDSCQPFWIVFNNEASEADHMLAIEWVEENLALEEHCDADLDGDHDIDVEDLLAVIEDWGCVGDCVGDVNDSGSTEIEDLLEIISDFGGECH